MGLSVRAIRIQASDMILAATMDSESLQPAEDAVGRLQRGELDALDVLLPQYQFRLYRFLLRMVREPATAEDLFQQTWVRVIEKISSHNARYPFDSWLFSIGRNLAIDHLRHKRGVSIDAPDERGEAFIDRMAVPGRDPLEEVLDFECGSIVASALEELPAIHREVLTLRFEEEMQLDQIAEVVGIPLSTVKSRLHRALQNLRIRVAAQLSRRGDK
jgi:RNA polymerase sigma-70 factor (ECF subfamily)